MIIVKVTVILAISVTICAGADETNNELVSNIVEDASPTTVTNARKYAADKQLVDQTSDIMSPKMRRSRYLRQVYRPRRRPPPPPPPFDMRMRNIRRPPPYPTVYPSRNHYKSARPYPPSKSRYRYQENWRHKWPEQNLPYGPYSTAAADEEEDEPAEHYDEYDEMEDLMKNEEPWLSKKYRDASYDDVMPVSSNKYTEKRVPGTRYGHHMQEVLRSRARPHYDMLENLRKESYAAWIERNRLNKNYRELLELLGSKKLLQDAYEDSFPANHIESHRLKMANLARFKHLEEDYDLAASSIGMKLKRHKSDLAQVTEKPAASAEENRYEQEVQNVAKYVAAHHGNTFPAKLELPQEVVYSAKYRGHGVNAKDDDGGKMEAGKLKSDEHSTPIAEDVTDWKRGQQPTYQGYMSDKMNYDKSETNIVRGQSYKPDHLLPSDLIAYMSANPTEQVVGKEERYLEPTYPYDILKAVFPSRKISPVIDHDLEITYDERLSDWKH